MRTFSAIKSHSDCLIKPRSLQFMQKGQALVETLSALILFLVMMLALKTSINISDRREGLLAQGLSMAMSSARGATLPGLSNTVIRHETDQRVSSQHIPLVRDSETQAMKELGINAEAWSIANGQYVIPIHSTLQGPGFIGSISIQSSIHVKGFPTHASDPIHVQKQLSQTTHLWGKPAQLTSHLSNLVSVQAHLTDVAWKRAKPNPDLLSAWKDH